MIELWQILAAGGFVVVVFGFVLIFLQLRKLNKPPETKGPGSSFNETALEEAAGLFNKEFHEELRNRGRLHFEKIISENAMFLKQDLDMTIAQMNEYLKKEITGKLDEEFVAYSKAMKEAQELALNSLQKSASAVEEQRLMMEQKLKTEVEEKEALLLKAYEDNMSKIIEHYILEALGDQFDLKAQLPFIISQMEANKQKIMDDMRL